jgi:hypothetical protein
MGAVCKLRRIFTLKSPPVVEEDNGRALHSFMSELNLSNSRIWL